MNCLSGPKLLYFVMGAKMHRLLLDIGHWLYGYCCHPEQFFSFLFPYYFHATFVLSLCYFNAISMLLLHYSKTISVLFPCYPQDILQHYLFPCYFTDDARNQSNYIKTNYPLEENGMYQRLLYLFTRFEVLPNSNWHQKSVFRENCLKWKLSVEIPYFAFSSCQHLTLWNTNTTIRLVQKKRKKRKKCFGETFGTQDLLMFCSRFLSLILTLTVSSQNTHLTVNVPEGARAFQGGQHSTLGRMLKSVLSWQDSKQQ